MKTKLIPMLALGLCSGAPLMAGDVYRRIPVNEIAPKRNSDTAPEMNVFRDRFLLMRVTKPYAVLEGAPAAEVYLDPGNPTNQGESLKPGLSFLAVRSPEGKELRGKLYLPRQDFNGLDVIPFTIPAGAGTSETKQFYRSKENHYTTLLEADLPGAAWFRHQAKEAALAQGTDHADEVRDTNRNPGFNRRMELEDTFELFSGGRAVSENLQLERLMNISGDNTATMDLAGLSGIKTKEMDWKSLVKDLSPQTDPLAASLPADQHALFFPGFAAMTQLLDEAEANGTPVLHLMEPKAEDANTHARYQKQLCLGTNELSRLLGPEIIDSVAFTGSDPYLRTGSDLSILFETKQPGVLQTLLSARQALAQKGNPAVKAVSGGTHGVSYTGVVSPDRSICSYLAVIKGVVVVTNSLHQVAALADVAAGKSPALAGLDEYTFFRNRYSRSDKEETAFLVLSDATIRRWCSPRWRIADSRRTLAAGVLAELTAAHLPGLVTGKEAGMALQSPFQSIDLGKTTLSPTGPISSQYGSLAFMTPISEITFDKVSRTEADAYNRWREGYETNWSQFFDPIAVKFTVSAGKLGAELTVMPLIAGTQYREAIALSTGAKISPGAGDPHGAVFHGITAFNAQSEPILSLGRSLSPMMPGLKANPFSWVGQSISYYVDDDPFWDRLEQAGRPQEFLEKNFHALPLAINIEVAKPLELALFLTTLHAFVEQSAPGLTAWENFAYKGRTYVKISAKNGGGMDQLKNLAVYYVTTPKSFLITLNENLLKRALDREEARSQPDFAPAPAVKAWLGESHGLQAGPRVLAVAEKLTHDSYHTRLQALSWANLPILNEWKRRYPDHDPVKFHEEFQGIRLVCPGGGTYSWNEEWNTMESSTFGHPGQPRDSLPATAFFSFTGINLGLTFEPNGLSAKGVIERPAK